MSSELNTLPPLTQQAIAAFSAGDFARAARLAEQAMAEAPSPGVAMIGIDSARALGQRPAAIAAARGAVTAFPKHARLHLLLANLLEEDGKPADATTVLGDFAKGNPTDASAQLNYAILLLRTGDLSGAELKLRRAIDLDPTYILGLVNLSTVLLRQNRMPEALAVARRAVEIAADRGEAQLAVAEALIASGKLNEALSPLRAAHAAPATRRSAEQRLREIEAAMTPPWLTATLNDRRYQQVLSTAIGAQTRAGWTALQIGSNAGLAAMTAMRAGAGHAYVCEPSGPLAAATRQVLQLNGYANDVGVIEAESRTVQVKRQLPDRADLLLLEPAFGDFLSGDTLASIEDAKARLLKPRGIVLPGKVTLHGVLIGGEAMEQRFLAGRVNGFDLSPVNPLNSLRIPVAHGAVPMLELSQRVDLFRFDLRGAAHFPEAQAVLDLQVRGTGKALGLLQWLSFELSPGLTYQNGPETEDSHLPLVFYPFARPIAVKNGQGLRIAIQHNRTSLTISATE